MGTWAPVIFPRLLCSFPLSESIEFVLNVLIRSSSTRRVTCGISAFFAFVDVEYEKSVIKKRPTSRKNRKAQPKKSKRACPKTPRSHENRKAQLKKRKENVLAKHNHYSEMII